jgi:hypothetical protein
MNRISETIFTMHPKKHWRDLKARGKKKRIRAQFMAISIPPAKISIKPNPRKTEADLERHANILLKSGMMPIDYVERKVSWYSGQAG